MPDFNINKRFVFAGNRFFVLEEMINAGLNVIKIFVVPDSYLEDELKKRNIMFTYITNKNSLIDNLNKLKFDYFICNGLPHILPITKFIKEDSKKSFINIHPSYLPDLRGKDPVPGSILYGRSSGATCHYMNDNIDEGDIIQQIKIEYSDEIDCCLLYQLSFIAEKKVFIKSLNTGFQITKKQIASDSNINYKIKDKDKILGFHENLIEILQKIKAFNTPSQGAYFLIGDKKFVVKKGKSISNTFIKDFITKYKENEVLFVFPNRIVIKKGSSLLSLEEIIGDLSNIKVGLIL